MARVSVIIPTYNHCDYVLFTLESVFAQTFTDYEIIVVNDGSPDDTEEALRPLIQEGRIRYIKQANAGQAAARNRGLQEAKGEFIAFLDDDDYWPLDKLEWQVGALHNNVQAVVVYGQVQLFDEAFTTDPPHPDANGPTGNVFERFLVAGWIRSPGQTLIRAGLLKHIGGLDTNIWGTDDWDLWLNLAKKGEFIYRPKVALFYRCHATNASKNFYRMYKNGSKVISKQLGAYAWLKDYKRWRAAKRFVRSFTSIDGLQETSRLIALRNNKSALIALGQLTLIRPRSCLRLLQGIFFRWMKIHFSAKHTTH